MGNGLSVAWGRAGGRKTAGTEPTRSVAPGGRRAQTEGRPPSRKTGARPVGPAPVVTSIGSVCGYCARQVSALSWVQTSRPV